MFSVHALRGAIPEESKEIKMASEGIAAHDGSRGIKRDPERSRGGGRSRVYGEQLPSQHTQVNEVETRDNGSEMPVCIPRITVCSSRMCLLC